jgi:8-oxo-dGTP pyrophosphatase MutT (NUDIX family)
VIQFTVESTQVEWEGRVLKAGSETYLFSDGTTHVYDKVWHDGAVTIVPYDEHYVWLVRQPRPASGQNDCLEIPAGKRDRPDEALLDLAKRELVEEIGKHASDWRTGGAVPDDDENIEIVPWPLQDINGAIEATNDGKTLLGLLWLARELGSR